MMSVFANTPFSRLWNGRPKPDAHSRSATFVRDATPPFMELGHSGLGRVPTSEELTKILYYNSKIAFRDSEFVVRTARPQVVSSPFSTSQ